jgi:hypothetical protein
MGMKAKKESKYPPFNFMDFNTLISWNYLRKIAFRYRKKLIFRKDLALTVAAIDFFFFFSIWILKTFFQSIEFLDWIVEFKWIQYYLLIDFFLAITMFSLRIYFQSNINKLYSSQINVLFNLQSMIRNLYFLNQNYQEVNQPIAYKDDAWYFYNFCLDFIHENFY